MKPVRVFRHIECEGPGYLGEVLDAQGFPLELIALDRGEAVPSGLDQVSGLVFMGGPMSANDPLPWIDAELALIRQATEIGLPVLGHCLGGQLISKALGGAIDANPVAEIGWHPVEVIDNPASRYWFDSQTTGFEAFHWHGERFSIPAGATPILSSPFCANQGFAQGNTLALQCHVEMTPNLVRQWSNLYQDQITRPSESVNSAEQIMQNLDERVTALQSVARFLYGRWLNACRSTCAPGAVKGAAER